MTQVTQIPLKYLFKATFADGSTIVQTPDDKSRTEPEKRSQFFDVLQQAKTTQLITFVLIGEGHEYGVDLRDGHFEIDGVAFRMHADKPIAFELVFFRGHTVTWEQSRYKDTETSHTVVYRMGWKAIGAQNYQRVMEFD